MKAAPEFLAQLTRGEIDMVHRLGRSDWALNSLLVSECELRRLHELGLVTMHGGVFDITPLFFDVHNRLADEQGWWRLAPP